MGIAAQHDRGARPVRADGIDQAAQPFNDLASAGSAGRTQHGGHHAAVTIEHHDGLEPVFIVVSVEQTELLLTVGGIERVIDVEHDPVRHGAEA